MAYNEEATQAGFEDRDPRFDEPMRNMGIVEARLNEREAPTSSAFMRQEKVMSELEMDLELLEQKLQAVSSETIRDETDSPAQPRSGSSKLVRAIEEQTDRIYRQSRKVRRIREGLEI